MLLRVATRTATVRPSRLRAFTPGNRRDRGEQQQKEEENEDKDKDRDRDAAAMAEMARCQREERKKSAFCCTLLTGGGLEEGMDEWRSGAFVRMGFNPVIPSRLLN